MESGIIVSEIIVSEIIVSEIIVSEIIVSEIIVSEIIVSGIMDMTRWLQYPLSVLLVAAATTTTVVPAPTALAETITIGLVGAVSATHWPIYVGLKQGYYAAQDIQLATVFTLSSNALVQQLASGSLDAALSTGIVDPIYAIDKGAPIALLRL